jgi:NADH:ubiquinone oxidoreductase subunit C
MLLIYNNYWVQKKYLSFLFKIAFKFINQGAIKHRVLSLKVSSLNIYPLSLFLKKHTNCLYKTVVDIAAYDCLGKYFRFCITYNLLSVGFNSRIFLVTKVEEKSPALPSVVSLYAGASWLEREVWDFFGIFFINNFDLRRLLTDYGFVGYPLRKDFPLTGFTEVVYNDTNKQITYKRVELVQDFREFVFKNTWK